MISLSAPGGIMEPRSYVLQTDKDSVATLFKIDVGTPGSYVIFAQVHHATANSSPTIRANSLPSTSCQATACLW